MASESSVNDPSEIINNGLMSTRQWIVVGVMVALNALDGFDILSSAFTAPGISSEWGINRSVLGVVLSAELVGMGVGSVLLGGVGDKLGRKLTMLGCLVVMAIGMFLASTANDVTPMVIFRFITGIGIGGMLAATNAVVAETSNKDARSISIAIYVAGYPIGAVLGGLVATGWLIPEFGWRSVFEAGAIVTAVLIPITWLAVPETAAYHASHRNLEGVNKTLLALGKSAIAQLPAPKPTASKLKVTDILYNPQLRPVTLMLAFGYMFHTITFYYILKFAVQIVSEFPPGYLPSEAGTVLTFASLGGAIGGFFFGFVMKKFGIKWPTVIMLLLGSLAVIAFGMGRESLQGWQLATLTTGLFTNAAITGYYAAFARGFPAHARASGTGFVLGVGRFGAAGSPLIAGALFTWLGNDALLTVSTIMAMGSIISLFIFMKLPERDGDEVVKMQQAE